MIRLIFRVLPITGMPALDVEHATDSSHDARISECIHTIPVVLRQRQP